MHVGGYQLSNGNGECTFVVGQKNCLTNEMYLTTDSGGNAGPYPGTYGPTFCNLYKNALPQRIASIFKECNVLSNTEDSYEITPYYFALPAEYEIFGKSAFAESQLEQLEYYKTAANRKKTGGYDTRGDYWTRTYAGDNTYGANYRIVGGSDGKAYTRETNRIAPSNSYAYPLGAAPIGFI